MSEKESPYMHSQPPLTDAEEAQLEEDLEWAAETFDNSNVYDEGTDE